MYGPPRNTHCTCLDGPATVRFYQRHLDPHRWRDGRAVIAVAILPHEKFSAAVVEEESKPDWYLRQMLGTANFNAGPLLAFSSGNLCYQIEHHLFPDLPSNRYAEIPTRVRALCGQVRPSLHHRVTAGPISCKQCGPSTSWRCRTDF